MTKNNIVQISLAHPVSHLNEMRRALGIPEEYTDERVLQSLVGNVIDNYMDVEHIDPEEIEGDLTDGRIAKRYLGKDDSSLKEAFDSGMNPDVPSKQ